MTKFKYKDKVKVVRGFYRGQTGVVLGESKTYYTWSHTQRYWVKMDKATEEYINEECLRLIK